MSLVLRHRPEVIGITLDNNGWADVNELIVKINAHGVKLDMPTLLQVVDENSKKRFSFNEDLTRIRANQGHSIEVDVELQQQVPPPLLYHGTSENVIKDVMQKGLLKMNRLHVHLSDNPATAKQVGSRHGKPIVFEVNALQMHEDGLTFYLSQNKVWLTEHVPSSYLTPYKC